MIEYNTKYCTPTIWVIEAELETLLLEVSSGGEDLVTDQFDPWLG